MEIRKICRMIIDSHFLSVILEEKNSHELVENVHNIIDTTLAQYHSRGKVSVVLSGIKGEQELY